MAERAEFKLVHDICALGYRRICAHQKSETGSEI
jgi:hypothetical protein